MKRRLEVGLHFGRHAHFDVLRFDVRDVDPFRKGTGELVSPDGYDAAQHQLAAVQNDNSRVFETDFDQGDHFLAKGFGLRHLKGIHRADKGRDDLIW